MSPTAKSRKMRGMILSLRRGLSACDWAASSRDEPRTRTLQSLQRLLCVQANECRSDCPLEEAQKNYALFSKYVRRQRTSPTITSLITAIGLTTIERIPFQRESTRPKARYRSGAVVAG